MRDSRSFKSPTFFPGLFDFSGTFLNDLTEKLKNLPHKEISQSSAVTKNTIDNEKNNKSDQSAYNCDVSDIKNDTLSIGIIEKKLIQTDKRSTTVNSTNSSSSSSSSSSNFKNAINDSNYNISDKCAKPGDDDVLSDGEIVEECNEDVVTSFHKHKNDDKQRKKEIKKSEIPLFDKISKSACVVVGMSRYEASKYCIEIISILDDNENKLVNHPIAYLLSQNDEISQCSNKSEITESGSRSKVKKILSLDKKNEKDVIDDFTIGRSRKNDFNIDDLSVSKNHAIISYYNNVGFILRDLSSKHGTFVNNKRIGIKNEKTVNVHEMENSIPLERNNDGLKIIDGMTLQFGRVICKIFRKRQPAIISHG